MKRFENDKKIKKQKIAPFHFLSPKSFAKSIEDLN